MTERTDCDEANKKKTICARRKGLLEQAKKIITGVRNHKQKKKRGGLITGIPDLCGAFVRRAIYGLRILTDNNTYDKDGVKTYKSVESAIRSIAKTARLDNGAIYLALDAQRSGLTRLITPLSI
jgi:hypothetical protein